MKCRMLSLSEVSYSTQASRWWSLNTNMLNRQILKLETAVEQWPKSCCIWKGEGRLGGRGWARSGRYLTWRLICAAASAQFGLRARIDTDCRRVFTWRSRTSNEAFSLTGRSVQELRSGHWLDCGRGVRDCKSTRTPRGEPWVCLPGLRSATQTHDASPTDAPPLSVATAHVQLPTRYLHQEPLVHHVLSPRHHIQFGDHGVVCWERGVVVFRSPEHTGGCFQMMADGRGAGLKRFAVLYMCLRFFCNFL